MSSFATSPATGQPQTSFDSREFRNALGSFATGVAVVTALDSNGNPLGLTINSFNSVSLEPPLVLWSLACSSPNLDAFVASSHYAINILAADQENLSNQFASRLPDKFKGIRWNAGLGGAPVLASACASFEVRNSVRHTGGDHLIFVGEVERFGRDDARAPLLYYRGHYCQLKD
jgi:flavin reductase (DIM6/NTAB) family NADH-FMN oxidoreductase RutF